jgi:hypothetical protein
MFIYPCKMRYTSWVQSIEVFAILFQLKYAESKTLPLFLATWLQAYISITEEKSSEEVAVLFLNFQE